MKRKTEQKKEKKEKKELGEEESCVTGHKIYWLFTRFFR